MTDRYQILCASFALSEVSFAWHGRVPPWASARIVERTGYDIAPVDATTPTGSGGAASPGRRPKPSPASPWQKARTVLHSVTWQYLSGGEQAGGRNGTDALAAPADSRAPFVHLMREPQRRTPDAVHEFLVRARSWPDGADEILAACAPHGPPVNWA